MRGRFAQTRRDYLKTLRHRRFSLIANRKKCSASLWELRSHDAAE
jgi:hypothetical protein